MGSRSSRDIVSGGPRLSGAQIENLAITFVLDYERSRDDQDL